MRDLLGGIGKRKRRVDIATAANFSLTLILQIRRVSRFCTISSYRRYARVFRQFRGVFFHPSFSPVASMNSSPLTFQFGWLSDTQHFCSNVNRKNWSPWGVFGMILLSTLFFFSYGDFQAILQKSSIIRSDGRSRAFVIEKAIVSGYSASKFSVRNL